MKRNIKYFKNRLIKNIQLFNEGIITKEQLENRVNGWKGYAKFGDSYNLMNKLTLMIPTIK